MPRQPYREPLPPRRQLVADLTREVMTLGRLARQLRQLGLPGYERVTATRRQLAGITRDIARVVP